jgi:hypothetical protein
MLTVLMEQPGTMAKATSMRTGLSKLQGRAVFIATRAESTLLREKAHAVNHAVISAEKTVSPGCMST